MKTTSAFTIMALVALLPGQTATLVAQAASQVVPQQLFADMDYRYVGPSRGGRATAVAGHADEPTTFYMGATGGGVWKTTDNGHNWINISDGFFATGSIGAIRVAESNSDIVYVGTGSDGIRSNVITGKGVYKSTDAGETWSHVGLETVGQIGAVLIHPTNPDLLYVAAIGNAFAPSEDRGVYRSSDGGATWDRLLFVSDSTGAVDLEFAPDNPAEIYASMWRAERKPWTIISGAEEGGVYKSSDAGATWTHLTSGLPQGLRGKSDLAVSAADPNRVYALMEAPVGEGGLYRSDDRGASWELVSTHPPLVDRPFYYTNVDADPTNADILWVNSTGYWWSGDAGQNWERRSTPHGDNHDMWINPNNPDIYVQSNDGGANVTLDGGKTWSSQHNQPTAELYQVNVDDGMPYQLYAGQQDNTTIRVPSRPPFSHPGGFTGYWQAIGGCETGPAVPKPGNPDIVYSNCKGRFGRYNQATGQEKQYYVSMVNLYGANPKDLPYRFQRVSPIHVSPHDPSVVYHGSQYLHKTTDEGVTWETISPDLTAFTPETQVYSGTPITRDITGEEHYSTLYAVQESPIQPGLIWAGANDGPIHVTRDGGANWQNVTPPDLGPGGRVQTVEPSPHQPNKTYVAVLRYQLNDWEPHIYRTNDYGETWTRLTPGDNGIPADHPTRVVREDPDREGLLYAGIEFGMFVSFDDGATWQPFQQNLPVTPVTDIKVHEQDLVLSTMGRGFWIADDLTPLHELNAEVVASSAHLFGVRDAHRARGGFGGFRVRSPSDPEFPQPGATIGYYLAAESAGDVTLEILDGEGNVVRTFSSAGGGEEMVEPAEAGMREPRLEAIGTPRLEKGAGLHRFTWNLQHAGPWQSDAERSGRNGPVVVPGIYTARMNVGDWSATQEIKVLMDPRVVADGVTEADVSAQVALALQVRDALTQARMAAQRIGTAREQLAERNDAASRQLDEQLASVEARLVTSTEHRYPVPVLIDQLSYLYGNLNRADQAPGQDAYARADELEAELAQLVGTLGQLIETDGTLNFQ